jgi:nitroreductase
MTTGGEMMSVLDRTIVVRHSIRKVPSPPVPRGVVDEALALTPYAPANSEMTTHGMYTERMFRLREARIEARRKLRREIAWFCVTLVTSMGLWAAAYAAWRWLVS